LEGGGWFENERCLMCANIDLCGYDRMDIACVTAEVDGLLYVVKDQRNQNNNVCMHE
jgi:hypothetical protein